MGKGELYNESTLRMGSHNGTHVDAPRHFVADGKTIEQVALERFVGPCFVTFHDGDVTADDARRMLFEAEKAGAGDRILIGGDATVTEDAAAVFAEKPILLVGNESQTVGPLSGPMKVHQILLGREVVLLEGIRLSGVEPGKYFLNAAPLKLGGLEGAPCRAWLMKE